MESALFLSSYNLEQNKLEPQTTRPKSRMKPRSRTKAKTRHFPILDLRGWGGGGGGGEHKLPTPLK